MRNYYCRPYASGKLKRQRPHRIEKMKEFRLLVYKEGLKTLSMSRMLKGEENLKDVYWKTACMV
ncbi:hypothetical protein [Brassicibacter mesophilus]|uniref:hypothetical protein n=1 Tax=Brassicibacter mesophilus TaxID=745119 RepID=UPI003D1A8234